MLRLILAAEEIDLNALLALAVDQKNWVLLVLVAVLILVPIVLKLLGKSFPGQEGIVKLLSSLAQSLAHKDSKEAPPEVQPGQLKVVRVEEQADDKGPKQ